MKILLGILVILLLIAVCSEYGLYLGYKHEYKRTERLIHIVAYDQQILSSDTSFFSNPDLIMKAKIRDSMVNELKIMTHIYPLYFEDLIQ